MKSIRYRNTVIISVIALAFVSVVLVFAYNMTKAKAKAFLKDGYVLNTLDESGDSDRAVEKSEVQHFDANTKYNKRWDGTIDFKNEKGEPVKASAKGFLYYNNSDLEVIDKAVLLDTNSIDGGKVASYSMPEGTVIKKAGENYELVNLEETITLEDYIWKVDETKYLVVSDQIEVTAQGEKRESLDKFVELTYVDGGIVRLTNDKYNYQTIMSDTKIKLKNDTEIDLNTRSVKVGDQEVTSLAKMLVDSDANVEIVENNRDALIKGEAAVAAREANGIQGGPNGPNGPAGGTTTNSTNNSSGTNNSSTSGGVVVSGGGGGSGNNETGPNADNNNNNPDDTNNPTEEEEEGDGVEVKFNVPQITINKFDVFATEIDVELEKLDKDNILSDDLKIIVFEKRGDVKLPEEVWPISETEKVYRTTRVRPDTKYVFQVRGGYKVGEESFAKVFLEKEFSTDNLGVDFNIKSTQTEVAIVNVSKDSGTAVKSATMVLYNDIEESVAKIPIDFSALEAPSTEVKFDGLEPNSRYKVAMESLSVGRETIDRLNEGIEFSTLKENPSIGKPIVKIDKVKQTFELSVDNIVDHSGGVKGVMYQVFSAGDTETPVVEQRRDATSSAIIQVDGNTIQQGSLYTFRAVVEYFDNEKIIEYSTVMSQVFSMSELKLPTVKGFELGQDGYIRFDAIRGYMRVSNPDRTIDEAVDATYDLSGDTAGIGDVHKGSATVQRVGDDILLLVEKNGLRAGQSYTLTATVSVNLLDGSGHRPLPLTSVTVTTAQANNLRVNFTDNLYDPDNRINFTIKLSADPATVGPPAEDPTRPSDYEATTMQELVFKVYRGEGVSKQLIGNLDFTATNPDPYNSSLKTDFYDQAFGIKDSFFSGIGDDLTAQAYTIVLDKVYDYTDNRNEIQIEGVREGIIRPNAAKPDNDQLKGALIWRQQTKAETGDSTPGLDSETVVSGNISYSFSPNTPISSITTRIYVDKLDGTSQRVGEVVRRAGSDGNINSTINFRVGRGTGETIDQDIQTLRAAFNNPSATEYNILRGLKYRFDYDAEFDLDHNGQPDFKATTIGTQGYELIQGWVSPAGQINKQSATASGQIKSSAYVKPTTGATDSGYNITYNVSKEDYDVALDGNKVTLTKGSVTVDHTLTTTANGDYTIRGLSKGLWQISSKIALNKSVRVTTGAEVTEKPINMGAFYLEGFTDINSTTGDSYISAGKTGRFAYTLKNRTGNTVDQFFSLEMFDTESAGAVARITKLRVKFNEKKTGSGTEYEGKTWVTVPLRTGVQRIPYAAIPKEDLQNLRGKNIALDVEVTYDTGKFQSKTTGNYNNVMMQEPYNGRLVGRYYTKSGTDEFYTFNQNSLGALQSRINFTDGAFTAQKDGESAAGKPINYGITGSTFLAEHMTAQGSNTSVWFKETTSNQISRRASDTIDVTLPNSISPTVSARNPVLGLDEVKFTTVINQAGADRADQYKIQLYKVNGNGQTGDQVGEQTIAKSTSDAVETVVTFGGMNDQNMLAGMKIELGTTYRAMAKGMYNSVQGGTASETSLLDAATGNTFQVDYETQGDVGILDFKHAVENKKLVFRHRMTPATILDRVEYILKNTKTNEVKKITKTKGELSSGMEVIFDLNQKFPLGITYELRIAPFATGSSGHNIALPGLTQTVKTVLLEGPRLTLTYSSGQSSQEGKARLRVDFTVNDSQGATGNIESAMNLRLLDRLGNEVNTEYTKTGVTSDTQISGMMVTEGLIFDTEYRLEVKGVMDSNLDGNKSEVFEQSYSIKTATKTGISAGDISLSVKDNNLVVSFTNSNNLISTDPSKGVKTVQYALYNGTGTPVKTGSENFIPTNHNNGRIYTYKINHDLGNAGVIYELRLTLYDANNRAVIDYNGRYAHKYE